MYSDHSHLSSNTEIGTIVKIISTSKFICAKMLMKGTFFSKKSGKHSLQLIGYLISIAEI